jgi:hypothetical protein
MQKNPRLVKFHVSLKIVKSAFLAFIVVLAFFACAASAFYSDFFIQNSVEVKSPNLQLIAGSDSTCTPNCPSANVVVSASGDFAKVNFDLFPSEPHFPQPCTYFTDLIQIKNVGSLNQTIKSIAISDISGVSNLGCITIYYLDSQTDNLASANPIATCTLNNSSNGLITVASQHVILPGELDFLAVAAYGCANAKPNAQISFTLSIQS